MASKKHRYKEFVSFSMFFLLPSSKIRLSCFFDVISGKKPPFFYTDTLRGFRAQGCASDRHKAPRSSLEEARWGDWRLIGAQARSRKRSTRGRVKTGSACPGVCAEPTRRVRSKLPQKPVSLVCAETHVKFEVNFPRSHFPWFARSPT